MIVMRSLLAVAAALMVLGMALPTASAREALVLLLECPRRCVGEARRQGLLDSLAIHLPRDVALRLGPRPSAAATGARVRQAQRELGRARGLLALWVDEDRLEGNEREVVVYMVARRRGRALVEVVRVRAGADAELDRAIAVKAREVLEVVTAPPEDLAAAVAEPAPTSPAEALGVGLALDLAFFGATASGAGADPQLGGIAGAGFALRGQSWFAEALFRARLPSLLGDDIPEGRVEVREVALGGALRAGWRDAPLRLGALVALDARWLSAEGTTPRGASGAADRVVPAIAFGPELGVAPLDWLLARATVGVELAWRRQRFLVNDEPILDVGVARGMAEIGLSALFF
jgi:hypothetical protein